MAFYLIGTTNTADKYHGKKIVLAVPASTHTDRIYQDILDDFQKKNPQIKVELLAVTGSYYQKVLVMLAGGVGPDLMWMGRSFSEFAEKGVFLDITERVKKSKKVNVKAYNPVVISWYELNNKLYALPYGIDMAFIVYNRELFRKYGVPEPHDDWCFKDFLSAAQKLTIRDENGKVSCYGFRGRLDRSIFDAKFIDDGKVTCNSPEMINYLKTNLELFTRYKVTMRPQDANLVGLDNYSYFSQGRVAMMVFYSWDLPFIYERFHDMDWGVVMNPRVVKQGQWGSSGAIAISRKTPYPDLAWKLLEKFQSERFQKAMSVRCLPSIKKYARDVVRTHKGKPCNFASFLKMSEHLQPTPKISHLQELNSMYYMACNDVWTQIKTPEQAMLDLEKKLKKRIKKFSRKQNMQKNRP